MDDNYLVRAQQTLGDGEGANSIVGDPPTRVTYYVRLPHLEPKNFSGCSFASMLGHNRDLAGQRHREIPPVEIRPRTARWPL